MITCMTGGRNIKMEKAALQIELCRHAVNLLRENCREKIESDEVLDLAQDVLLMTFNALMEASEGKV